MLLQLDDQSGIAGRQLALRIVSDIALRTKEVQHPVGEGPFSKSPFLVWNRTPADVILPARAAPSNRCL